MALVTCPECFRENVSSTAERCLGCGFGISKYFEAKYRAEDEKNRMILQKEKDEMEYQKRLGRVSKPKKPRINFGCLTLTLLPFGYGAFMSISTDNFYSFIGYLALGVGALCLYIVFKWYSDSKKDYQKYQENPMDYKRMMVERRLTIEKAIEERKAEEASKVIYCPNCKKPTGEQLSTIGKAASVSAFGISSNKVGKTYQCSNCKYLW